MLCLVLNQQYSVLSLSTVLPSQLFHLPALKPNLNVKHPFSTLDMITETVFTVSVLVRNITYTEYLKLSTIALYLKKTIESI